MRVMSEVLVVVGAAWSLLAAIGVLRFEDVYSRMHAATKSTTLGLLLVLVAAAIRLEPGEAAKVLLAGGLLFLTAPIGAHLVGRAVHKSGGPEVHIDDIDELRAADEREERADREQEGH